MEVFVKRFYELSCDELYEIMKVRVNVFVVEQKCPYPELDDIDKRAYHVYIKDKEEIVAYLRVFDENEIRLGRVLSTRRRQGLGTKVLEEGIKVAKEKLNANQIVIEAQVYAKELYEKLGFVQISDEFLEDGIPHIKMELEIKSCN